MGSSNSCIPPKEMDDYLKWTYLNKKEIITLYQKFERAIGDLNPDPTVVLKERIPAKSVFEIIPQIKFNLFNDRIIRVFSSKQDDCFSFEDLLDFFSVMSKECPVHVKARWAYRLFNFDDKKQINHDDLRKLIEILTDIKDDKNLEKNNNVIKRDDLENILKKVMQTMDVEDNDSIEMIEFEHALKNCNDFKSAFTCEP